MPSLATLLLWGPLALGAALIPIVLHFFYRSRFRVVPWAAMEFLLTSIQQTSRRLKFQEILLLAARVSLMLLLALTMMRPSCSSLSAGRGEAVDAVLVLDTSYSMAAKEGGQTRLERAKDAAHRIIDSLPPSSTVQIIAGADRAALLGPRTPSNLDQARQLIDSLEVTDQATDFLPSAKEALDALKRGHAANKEVYLFSDMQKLGWEREGAAVKDTFDKIRRDARVVLVRCGDRVRRNATITGILPYSHFPQTGERSTYVVQVKNTGTEPVRDVTVTLEIDGQSHDRDARTLDVIQPAQTRTATLTAKPSRPGLQILSATLGPDDLAADNRFEQVVNVRDKVRVLVVDGAPGERKPDEAEAYYLVEALKSIGQTQNNVVQTRYTTPKLAAAAFLADADVCILVDVALKSPTVGELAPLAPEFIERLDAFVKEGHGLVVFAGPRVDAKNYNAALFERYPLLPLKVGKAYTTPADRPMLIDTESASPSSYLGKFREAPLDILGKVEFTGAVDLEPPSREQQMEQEGAAVLLRYTNGKPAVASKQRGNGEVIFVTTTANAAWNDWGKFAPASLPFLTETLKHLLQAPLALHNRRAGETLAWYPPVIDQAADHQLLTPRSEEIRLDPPRTAGQRAVVVTHHIERAGVYRIVPVRATSDAVTKLEPDRKNEPVGALYAVTPDLRESEDLSAFSDTEIDGQLGFLPVHLTAGAEMTADSVGRTGGEWWWYLLLAVIGIASFETVLAWVCSRAW
jgi:hypothetical protein